jgi:hypothetical protein
VSQKGPCIAPTAGVREEPSSSLFPDLQHLGGVQQDHIPRRWRSRPGKPGVGATAVGALTLETVHHRVRLRLLRLTRAAQLLNPRKTERPAARRVRPRPGRRSIGQPWGLAALVALAVVIHSSTAFIRPRSGQPLMCSVSSCCMGTSRAPPTPPRLQNQPQRPHRPGVVTTSSPVSEAPKGPATTHQQGVRLADLLSPWLPKPKRQADRDRATRPSDPDWWRLVGLSDLTIRPASWGGPGRFPSGARETARRATPLLVRKESSATCFPVAADALLTAFGDTGSARARDAATGPPELNYHRPVSRYHCGVVDGVASMQTLSHDCQSVARMTESPFGASDLVHYYSLLIA